MQQRVLRIASPVLVAATVGGIIWVSAGDLDPPAGPVTPTMKTLAEVEPRIAVNATNTPGDASYIFKITQPGSYYLTGNVTGAAGKSGFRIISGRVTLDLNGFTLEGAGGSIAIEMDCVPDAVIKNGFISNWTAEGILGEDSTGLRIENVHIRNVSGETVLVGSGTVVLDSSIRFSDGGFQVGARSRVERCVVRACPTGTAIVASTGSLVADCMLNDNEGGIRVSGAGSVVRDNVIKGSGIVGIRVAGVTARDNRIEGNHVTGGAVGLQVLTEGNYVADNTVKGNDDNYDFIAGNQLNILLCEIPESIDWPATVTLAGSLTGAVDTDGLTITADDVTVDLAGHALIGAPGSTSGDGIHISGRTNVEIRNGTVRDFALHGIREASNDGRNHRIIGVRTVSNGLDGIRLRGGFFLVKDCTTEGNGSRGIIVDAGSTVTGNTANSNASIGISASAGSTVTGNTAILNGEEGIFLSGDTLVDQNTATANNQSVGGFANISACASCTFGVNHAP